MLVSFYLYFIFLFWDAVSRFFYWWSDGGEIPTGCSNVWLTIPWGLARAPSKRLGGRARLHWNYLGSSAAAVSVGGRKAASPRFLFWVDAERLNRRTKGTGKPGLRSELVVNSECELPPSGRVRCSTRLRRQVIRSSARLTAFKCKNRAFTHAVRVVR